MVAPVKALLAVGILGAGATGGTFLFKGLGPGMPVYKKLPDQPTWKPVWKDKDFSTTYKKDNFGHDYQDLFVGAEESSKDWWDDAYNRFKREDAHQDFKGESGISSAFSDNKDARALNQVCKSFYKQDADTVEGRSKILTGHFRFQESKVDKDVWKYCSPLGENPISPDIFFYLGKYSDTKPGDISYLEVGALGQLLWAGDIAVSRYSLSLPVSFRRRMAIMLDKAWGLNEYKDVGPAAKSKPFSGGYWPENIKNKIAEERNKGIYYDIDIIDKYCGGFPMNRSDYSRSDEDYAKLKEDIYKFCTLKGRVDNNHDKHYLSIEDSIETALSSEKDKKNYELYSNVAYAVMPSPKSVKNKDWWGETFKDLQKDQTSKKSSLLTVLQEVKKEWSDITTDLSALNQACNNLLQNIMPDEDNKIKSIKRLDYTYPTRNFQKDKADWDKYKSNLEKYCTFKMNKREEILFRKYLG